MGEDEDMSELDGDGMYVCMVQTSGETNGCGRLRCGFAVFGCVRYKNAMNFLYLAMV